MMYTLKRNLRVFFPKGHHMFIEGLYEVSDAVCGEVFVEEWRAYRARGVALRNEGPYAVITTAFSEFHVPELRAALRLIVHWLLEGSQPHVRLEIDGETYVVEAEREIEELL